MDEMITVYGVLTNDGVCWHDDKSEAAEFALDRNGNRRIRKKQMTRAEFDALAEFQG